MTRTEHVDEAKAMKQWETLKTTIEKAGGVVKVMEPEVSRSDSLTPRRTCV